MTVQHMLMVVVNIDLNLLGFVLLTIGHWSEVMNFVDGLLRWTSQMF